MCCLFGLIGYGDMLTPRQKNKILSILSEECEVRGTDAAGFAYNLAGEMHIYKKPGPAHKLRWRIPAGVQCVIGHTRMTTQGSEKRNYNNHPFLGQISGAKFALAHNGVLYNDKAIRKTDNLPETKIETDSYIAVQLLEKQGSLSFDSLKHMAEKVEGSFCFTVLDEMDNWYLIKGENPMCLCRFPKVGVYLYASTEAILEKAIQKIPIRLGVSEQVSTDSGDIIKINSYGQIARSRFEVTFRSFAWRGLGRYFCPRHGGSEEYADELRATAAALGLGSAYVDELMVEGFGCEDIEEILYDGQSVIF